MLVHGPPAGGKSSYARALALRIEERCGRPIVRVEPADLLERAWGATERRVADLWRRASRDGATLVADEFDSLCGRREPDAPASGNAYLVRCLTNEFLRQLDDHPDVPLIATTNDPLAIDASARRRFQLSVEMPGRLSAEQELLAWRLVLGTEPPPRWRPGGAAVGDYAAALARCRLVGRSDAAGLAAALAEAHALRLGRAPGGAPRAPPLH